MKKVLKTTFACLLAGAALNLHADWTPLRLSLYVESYYDADLSFPDHRKYDSVCGLSLGLINCDDYLDGIQIAGIGNRLTWGDYDKNYYTGDIYCVKQSSGIQIACVFNIAEGHEMTGFQIAGIYNEILVMNGVQIGMVNYCENLSGIQFGLVNISGETKGFQIGVFNRAEFGKPIVQIGLWNQITDPTATFPFMPIVNARF